MKLPHYSVVTGKSIKRLAEIRGGGSALPGLVIEKIDKNFMKRTLEELPHGTVLISGTNGKTTTTKMVVELLEGQGLTVFTNRTGSNFTRGVAAALLGAVDYTGKLNADIAVLELDEAHAVHFANIVSPRFSLFLNVMRDQLDRFGEIDTTAKLLHAIAEKTTEGIVLNRDDPRLSSPAFTAGISAPTIRYYGVSPSLLAEFPSDDSMRKPGAKTALKSAHSLNDTVLESYEKQTADISFDGATHHLTLKLKGIYNVQNAVGAIAITRIILSDALNRKALLTALENVTPAFGRGETIQVNGQPCELVLVKNPSGFRLSLSSFDATSTATMIAINDNYADGRDMSWLWDVDFESLQQNGVASIGGVRAYDMALRLQYDDVEIEHIDTDLRAALKHFISTHQEMPKRIFTTYTAMLKIRRELAKIADVSEVRA